MVRNIIGLVIVVAVITLIISIFPIVYEWLKVALEWILSLGKWGVIILISCMLVAVFDMFR
jgi:uncharacterized membrane protein YdjX (TVP38/TMEM64 family)